MLRWDDNLDVITVGKPSPRTGGPDLSGTAQALPRMGTDLTGLFWTKLCEKNLAWKRTLVIPKSSADALKKALAP